MNKYINNAKLDFSEAISVIFNELKSKEIVKRIDESLDHNYKEFDGSTLTTDLLRGRSSYKKLIENKNFKNILNNLEANRIYSDYKFSKFLNETIETKSVDEYLTKSEYYHFYTFHKSLIKIHNLTSSLFLNNKTLNEYKSTEEGYIIFRSLNGETGRDIDFYIDTLKHVKDLCETLAKYFKSEEEKSRSPKVILLDSGSDTNIGIQTIPEVAKALFKIFTGYLK